MSKPNELQQAGEETVLKKTPGFTISSKDDLDNFIYLALTKIKNDESVYIVVNKTEGLASVYADLAHIAYDVVKRKTLSIDNVMIVDGGSTEVEPNLPYIKNESDNELLERKRQAFAHMQLNLETKKPWLGDLVRFFSSLYGGLLVVVGLDVTENILQEIEEAEEGSDWWERNGLLEYWNGEKSITQDPPGIGSIGDIATAGISTTQNSND